MRPLCPVLRGPGVKESDDTMITKIFTKQRDTRELKEGSENDVIGETGDGRRGKY